MTGVITLAVLLLFCGASFFFALAETSLFSLGKWQTRQLQARAPRAGQVVGGLLESPQDLLAALVLGNSFANAGIVGVMFWVIVQREWPMGLAMLGVLAVILFGCEAAPKILAVRDPESWSLRVALPMRVLLDISRPLRRVAQRLTNLFLRRGVPSFMTLPVGLSDEEYQELLEMAFQQGALAAGEKEIILQIISLDRRRAGDVMKGRTRMACISDDLSIEEMVEAARRFKHRRLPIYDETPDTIVGVLNTRSFLLDPHRNLEESVEFPSFVPESMNLLQLLKSLQRQRRGLAIVLDEFGTTAGIITIEDILAEVVGELPREHPPDQALIEKLSNKRWRVGGAVRLDNFRREYPQLEDISGIETMGGLVLHQLEVVPVPGQSVVFSGLRLTVQAADERRVRELLVEVVRKR
jgi:CBS domain containing-hemolysin-like protein